MFPDKSRKVRDENAVKAWERQETPSSPIQLYFKSSSVREEFAVRAWKREEAPASPILLSINVRLLREEFALRAWERQIAPESPILFPHKNKSVGEEVLVRAWEIAAAKASFIPLSAKSTIVTEDKSRWLPIVQTRRGLRVSSKIEHSNNHSQVKCVTQRRSSEWSRRELMCPVKLAAKVTAVSWLCEAMNPPMNKNTWFSLFKYRSSATTEAQSICLLIIWNAR